MWQNLPFFSNKIVYWWSSIIFQFSGPFIPLLTTREKGSNSEREMAYAMYVSGFDVIDVHMTDLMSGREDLTDIKFLCPPLLKKHH